jgi:para-nitrobenzyl esterase
MRALFSAALLFLISAATGCSASDPSLLRRVSTGLVQGSWAVLKQNPLIPTLSAGSGRVAVWRSIPYGQPPVAQLRWRPPLPALAWSGTLDGSIYTPPCIQSDGSGSEDCLHLHVTAPPAALNATAAPLPVLVYIHGGGLMDGSGNFE